jgi:5-methylcytosine-specific restriction endonuclease McrBC GTP-binding regulatory subunit McrB
VRWLYQGNPLDITDLNQNKTMTLSTVYKLSCTSQDIIKLVNANIQTKHLAFIPSNKPFVFIIDEINRGEISKIFGELFFSIDPGYRGEKNLEGNSNRVDTQYQEMVEDDDVFKKGFFVPDNVYLIGTMNDIDRSVESMDFAMRRRFTWQEITADESADNMNIMGDARKRFDALNTAIAEIDGLGKEFQIGGAIFLGQTDMDKLWRLHLNSLLREYLRGMPDEDDKFKKLKDAFDLKITADEQGSDN